MDLVSEYAPNTRPTDLPSRVRIGVDIGQVADPSAIVVVEVAARRPIRKAREAWGRWGDYVPSKLETHFLVRHVERRPLREPYPDVATRLVGVVEGVHEMFQDVEDFMPLLLVDSTGVGRPVVDMIRGPLRGRAMLTPVVFTGTERLEHGQGGELRMGKTHMVSRLTALMQQRRLHIPDEPAFRELAKEMDDYELRVNSKAHLQAGAFKSGAHDDLATALGLAVLLPYSQPTWEIIEL